MKRVVQWTLPPEKLLFNEHKLTLLTVCDDKYYYYAESLIRSIDVFSPGLNVVLHLINPSKDTISQSIHLATLLKNTIFCISFEKINLRMFLPNDRKTYYASARFLRIPELLEELESDILCLDSDSLIVNKFDYDFTDKDEADICLIRRDLEKEVDIELAVATGTIYSRCRTTTLSFYHSLCEDLQLQMATGSMPWFLDQALFAKKMYEMKASVAVRNIKRKYADWTFRENSIVWAGKGDRKVLDLKFATLQNLLSSNEFKQTKYLKSIFGFTDRNQLENNSFYQKIEMVRTDFRPLVTIYLPRLDLPWKKYDVDSRTPKLSRDTIELRLNWMHFCIELSNALEREGLIADIQEVPAWEITLENINSAPSDFVFIPHRCSLDFPIGKVNFPINFYMQEYFSWLFTVDSKGWSAASSVYPIDLNNISEATVDYFQKYKSLLSDSKLTSKFKQSDHRGVEELVVSGEIPGAIKKRSFYSLISPFKTKIKVIDTKFIFFPLQIPHDQSIKYFSDVDEIVLVNELLQWSQKTGVPIVFKLHPANLKSMLPLEALIREKAGYISDASIHELIPLADAVYTINSGVGFESMFFSKPIVTFGRAEYDCVTFGASIETLDAAWEYCVNSRAEDLENRYSKFFNWFIAEYAFDLTDSEAEHRFRYLAKRVKKSIASSRARKCYL